MDADLKDLCSKMLLREPEARLGAGVKGSSNDYAALKAHKAFKGIKWEKLAESKPPIKETLSNLNKSVASTPEKKD